MALRDYLASRRSEIEQSIKALKAELAEIRTAEEALGSVAPAARTNGSGTAREVRKGTIQDWVMKAMAALAPDGGTTEDVIACIQVLDGPEVPRNSMTPQLSRLKARGLLELHGRSWTLPAEAVVAEAQMQETPPASAGEVSMS